MDCERARNLMAEYIGQNLDDNVREEVSYHLDSCDGCFNEAKRLDRTIWTLECDCRGSKTPQSFLNGIEEKVLAGIKPHMRLPKAAISKKIIGIAAAATAVVLLVAAFMRFVPLNIKYKVYAAATFGKVYSTDEGTFGRKLSISSTSSDIKVTATKISADDMDTVIYFKAEGPDDGYYPDYSSVVTREKLKKQTRLGMNPLSGVSFVNGGFALHLNPVETGTKMLHLSISRMIRTVSRKDEEIVNGSWSFEIPVEKINSAFYDMNKSYDLNGFSITIKELVSGPTGTYLQYVCDTTNPEKFITGFNECELINNKKIYKEAGGIGLEGNISIHEFTSMYPDNPGKVTLNVKSLVEVTTYIKNIRIPVSIKGPFPMSFQYNGSTITIDNFKNDGGNIKFDLIEPSKGRSYDSMFYRFQDEKGANLGASVIPQKYYIIDENNVEYSSDDLSKNNLKYMQEGKRFQMYATDTAISFSIKDKDMKCFNMVIDGSQNIDSVNKSITIK